MKALLAKYPFWQDIQRYKRRYTVGFCALVFVDIVNVCMPLVVKEAIDAVPRRDSSTIYWMGLLYVLGILVLSSCRYLWRVYLIGTSHFIARDYRLKFYKHLQRLPMSVYQKYRVGDLMSRGTNDVEAIRMAVGPGVLVAVDATLIFLFMIPVMFWLSWKLTLMAFAFFPLVPLVTTTLGKRIDTLFDSLQAKMSKMGAFSQELLSAVRTVKSMRLELVTQKYFLGLSDEYRQEGLKLARTQAVLNPILTLLTYGGVFLILRVGGVQVIDGVVTVGTFVAFHRFVVQLQWPMEAIGWAVMLSREGSAANKRFQSIMAIAPAISVRVDQAPVPASPVLQFSGGTFSYPDTQFTLHLPRFSVEQGKKIGIVGAVGSGKSTLFSLVNRMHEPPIGSIFLQGQDVAAIPLKSLRRRVAVVEQEIFLFSETLEENLRLGNDSNFSDMKELSQALMLWEDINRWDGGFQTLVGERGVTLSGGQKQRMAILRALGRGGELLLLDDCFSAVDVAVEQKIIQTIFGEKSQTTVILASHRLSVMPLMDEVWLLSEGKFLARGRHSDLLEKEAVYQALWEEKGQRRTTGSEL